MLLSKTEIFNISLEKFLQPFTVTNFPPLELKLFPNLFSHWKMEIPVMKFDCSLIQIDNIKTFVFLEMQVFQNLPPHLNLDQITDWSFYCLDC